MTLFFSYKYYTQKETIMFENAKNEVETTEDGLKVSTIGVWNIDNALCAMNDEVYDSLDEFIRGSEENKREVYRQAVFCANHGLKFFGIKLSRMLGMEIKRLNEPRKETWILIPKEDVETYRLQLTRLKSIPGPLNPAYQEFRTTFM